MTDPFVDDLLSFGFPVYVVLDGAIVDDIEVYLKANDLVGRPLFRESTDHEVLLAGPWMISVGMDSSALQRSVAAARGIGKGVFWLGGRGEDTIFAHLRKLNAARMPDGRVMFFRHYDSDVLVAVAPLLGAAQAAYLFGPSRVLGFVGGEGDSRTIEKPDDLPEAAAGPLEFEQWQLDELNQRQRRLDKKAICRALRDEYPEQTRHLDEHDLEGRVSEYEKSAQGLNLTSRPAILNWARLNMEDDGGASKNEQLKNNILSIPVDYRNKVFLQDTPKLLESARRARTQAPFVDRVTEGRLLN